MNNGWNTMCGLASPLKYNSLPKALYGYCLILSSALLGLGYVQHISNVSSKLTDHDSGKISKILD
jgi:hypothetical protein